MPRQRRRLIAPQRAAPKGRHARHASYSCLWAAWPTCLSFCPPAAIREPDLQGRPPRKPCPVAQLDTDVGRIMSVPHRTLTPGCPSPVETAQATAVGISAWEVRCSYRPHTDTHRHADTRTQRRARSQHAQHALQVLCMVPEQLIMLARLALHVSQLGCGHLSKIVEITLMRSMHGNL